MACCPPVISHSRPQWRNITERAKRQPDHGCLHHSESMRCSCKLSCLSKLTPVTPKTPVTRYEIWFIILEIMFRALEIFIKTTREFVLNVRISIPQCVVIHTVARCNLYHTQWIIERQNSLIQRKCVSITFLI